MEAKRPVVQFVPVGINACSYYRLQQQMFYAMVDSRAGYTALHADPNSIVYVGQNILYLQRVLTKELFEPLIEFKKKTGVKVIVDYDDLIWATALPKYNGCLRPERAEKYRKDMEEYLPELADIVTCSTEYLKEALGCFHDDVRVFPNCLAAKEWSFGIRPLPSSSKFFYAGSPTHYSNEKKLYGDWTIPWVNFVKLAGIKVMGSQPPWFLEGYGERCPFVYPNGYARALLRNTEDCGFVLATLEDNAFNRAKSDLKYLEASAIGRVALVSEFPGSPYTHAHPLQKVPQNAGIKEIEAIVQKAADNYGEILKYQYEYLSGRWLDNWIPKYTEMFQELVNG